MKVGEVVDDFSAIDQDGNTVELSNLTAVGPVVVYFYIKAKTPG